MKLSHLPLHPSAPTDDGTGQRELLGLLLQDPPAGHELLMRRHNRLLFRVARSIVTDDEEATCAVVATYLRAFDALQTLPPDGHLSTWLVRLVIREARQRQRERQQALALRADRP